MKKCQTIPQVVILRCHFALNFLFAQISFLNTGNVGIGTTNPTEKLTVNGNIEIQNGAGTTIGYVFNNAEALNLQANSKSTGLEVGTSASLPIHFYTDGHTNRRMTIANTGNVGIGTATPTEKLSVNGNIKAKKLIVTQTGWADYVFDKNYTLMPVDSLSTYIKTHKHLPEMPTTKDVQNNGVDVGNNQALLLKKIEELTLYIIEQHKEIEALKKKIKAKSLYY